MKVYRPHRLLPLLFGALVLCGSSALVGLGSVLGESVLWVVGAPGAALGLSMILWPLWRDRPLRFGEGTLAVGRRRYPLARVKVERLRSAEIRGIEVLTFELLLPQPDGTERPLVIHANTYWPFEQLHRELSEAAEAARQAASPG